MFKSKHQKALEVNMITTDFLMEAIKSHLHWKGHGVVGCSPGIDGVEKACVILSERPFNKWVPLSDMNAEDFSKASYAPAQA